MSETNSSKDYSPRKLLKRAFPLFLIFLAACGVAKEPSQIQAMDTPKPELADPATATLEPLPSPVPATPFPSATEVRPFPETPVSPIVSYEFTQSPEFEFDFNAYPEGALEPGLFNVEVGTLVASYNHEAQYFTDRPENLRIETLANGEKVLVIQAIKEKFGEGEDARDYTSARVTTKDIFDFMYGKVVVEAKLPKGVGTWPALWMLSTDELYTQNATEDDWNNPIFYAMNGEIDFMEHQGADPGTIHVNTHTYASLEQGDYPHRGSIEVPDASEEFHAYGIEWTPDEIRFTLDGEVFHTVKRTSDNPADWPFNQRYHLIFNLALGGSWAETLANEQGYDFPGGIDDSEEQDWRLEIKKISFFPYLEASP